MAANIIQYTFPTEASMRDLTLARSVYSKVVQQTLPCGTTTSVYFATLDVDPTKVLVDVASEDGQRALIGKVSMDRNAPNNCCQSLEQNLKETKEIILCIRNHPSPRQQQHSSETKSNSVLPLILQLISPRFIPTFTPALLDGSSDIAKEISMSYDNAYI
jgi:guanine deaminase